MLREAGRTVTERSDIGRAEENVETLREKLEQLEQELKAEIEETEDRFDIKQFDLEALPIRPRKGDLKIEKVALLWVPR